MTDQATDDATIEEAGKLQDAYRKHEFCLGTIHALISIATRRGERIKELETSIVSHFQREHLEGDGPEIDRWRAEAKRLLVTQDALIESYRMSAEKAEAERGLLAVLVAKAQSERDALAEENARFRKLLGWIKRTDFALDKRWQTEIAAALTMG